MIASEREQLAIKQGLEQWIELEKINTIKEMIKNDATIDFISKVTNKTHEEIKKIEESMKD